MHAHPHVCTCTWTHIHAHGEEKKKRIEREGKRETETNGTHYTHMNKINSCQKVACASPVGLNLAIARSYPLGVLGPMWAFHP